VSIFFCIFSKYIALTLEEISGLYDKIKLASFILYIIPKDTYLSGRLAMYYEAELNFLRKALKKMRLQASLICPDEMPEEWLDFGLRKFLGQEDEYTRAFQTTTQWAKENTIYKLTDPYLCNYIFLLLPDTIRPTVFLVGPYMSFEITQQQILEEAERFGVPPLQFRQLEQYYSSIPVLTDVTPLLLLIFTFAERLWGEGAAYEIIDINQDYSPAPATRTHQTTNIDEKNVLLQMKIMETRYKFENELMEIVSKGLVHRTEMMLSSNVTQFMEQRMADPLRNIKNYCIVCNTIMRKAAEQGGVHPLHLDGISSSFAREIESISTLSAGQEMIGKMIRSYCRLVKKHSSRQYSSPVQKAVTVIDSDLSGDLSLNALASLQGINASYLSTLFKKETGQTVTDYVNRKRVDHAAHLLTTTKLQIQTIAQHCGISDVNYFSKIFKRYTNRTPKEYRKHAAQKL